MIDIIIESYFSSKNLTSLVVSCDAEKGSPGSHAPQDYTYFVCDMTALL